MPTVQQLLKKTIALPHHIHKQWLSHCLNKDYGFLITNAEYTLTDAEFDHYQQGMQQLLAGKPLAYLIGHQAFWKLDFMVNSFTLIPRPDTEILIEIVLNLNKDKQQQPLTVLDLGTGSGCIAISLASECPTWQVLAVDRCQQALAVAQQNAQKNNIHNVSFLQSDWFQSLNKQTKFDIIVSNPPYIADDDPHLANLTDEPITALVAEQNGLADIYYLIENAKNFLKNQGLLVIEHGYQQGKMVKQCFLKHGYYQVATWQDYGKNDRITLGFYDDCVD